ncbi:hypothetical protein BCR33DRAFT_849234 [Rhizoclosmatium globosum]|uniref:Uncharacterized protein n=1 Tax=Rhizoclosmatium globosum TaxID=329046 RepID=A0A1Y2CHN2_9FUNG|nr:hypothetical protein BCR33DRAFT_849234 [Rhizoclosmatium globosum]|eukprot:ORY46548.1 hypothetical protein BCR33DRAFT_849234 [Rhizoclosmatium globosum]
MIKRKVTTTTTTQRVLPHGTETTIRTVTQVSIDTQGQGIGLSTQNGKHIPALTQAADAPSPKMAIRLETWPVSKLVAELLPKGTLVHVNGTDVKEIEIEGVKVRVRQDDATKLELLRSIISSGNESRISVDLLGSVKVGNVLDAFKAATSPVLVYHSETEFHQVLNKANQEDGISLLKSLSEIMERSEHACCQESYRQIRQATSQLIHIFRTNDPAVVLVVHDAFKQACIQMMVESDSEKPDPTFMRWFLRDADLDLFLNTFEDPEMDKLPYATRYSVSLMKDALIRGITVV